MNIRFYYETIRVYYEFIIYGNKNSMWNFSSKKK